MRVFVTGATGVIGRRAVPLLVASGHRVSAVGRNAAKRAALDRQGAMPVELDLFSREAVRRAVARHDAVVNLATHIPPGMRAFLPGAWRQNDRLRRVASEILASAALAEGADRFVQESFAPAYPDRGQDWIDEGVPLAPVRYNRTVVDAERSARLFTDCGRTGVVLRFGAFYGSDADYVQDFVRWVRRGFAPLPGPPESFFSSVSHDDAAAAVMVALGLPAGSYNVVDDEPLSHREVVDTLAAALGTRPPRLPPRWLAPVFGSLGELLARSQRISNRKLRGAAPWRPTCPSLREGWLAAVAELRRSGKL